VEIKKNNEYIVDIIDNGINGEGIAKIDGFTIFIQGAIKGEKVKIKILKVLTTKGYGKILDIIKKSDSRCIEDCNTYKRCGGCTLRHIKYGETLNIKKNIVKNTLKKQNLEYVKLNDCIGMENPFFYRNKLQYPFAIDTYGKAIIGVFAERTHTVIETKKCMIQNELIQNIAKSICELVNKYNIQVYNEKTGKGSIRHIVIRIGAKTAEVMVTLVINDDKEKNYAKYECKLIEDIKNKYKEVKTIVKNINNKNTNVILGDKNEVLYGDGYIFDELLGYKFKISNMSFYQVNPVQTEKLYSKAIEYADIKKDDIIFDLYCGIGTIGICASKNCKHLYGIETIKEAIDDAKENAKINKVDNSTFFVGNVEDVLPKFVKENNIVPDVVFIDPPRKGCDKIVLDTILNVKPKKVVYISCNPATLARDLKILENEYEIKEVTPVDMFSFTSHVEGVATLQLK